MFEGEFLLIPKASYIDLTFSNGTSEGELLLVPVRGRWIYSVPVGERVLSLEPDPLLGSSFGISTPY